MASVRVTHSARRHPALPHPARGRRRRRRCATPTTLTSIRRMLCGTWPAWRATIAFAASRADLQAFAPDLPARPPRRLPRRPPTSSSAAEGLRFTLTSEWILTVPCMPDADFTLVSWLSRPVATTLMPSCSPVPRWNGLTSVGRSSGCATKFTGCRLAVDAAPQALSFRRCRSCLPSLPVAVVFVCLRCPPLFSFECKYDVPWCCLSWAS